MPAIFKSKKRKRSITLSIFILFGFLASGFFLKMSFSSQAPEGNWSEPWYNDCEEVSIVMVDSFYNNRILTNAIAKKEILKILDIKEEEFGPSLSENAEKIVDLINNFLNLNWKAKIVEDPTIEQIKEQIDSGNPIILPTDGRKLNNRYYTTSHYHVFVISGYDENKEMFIVQDPGTYRGKNYQYSYGVIENAMHDYDPEDLSKGKRVAIFTSLEIKNSEINEDDKAGEEKIEELKDEVIFVLSDAVDNISVINEEAEEDNPPMVLEKRNENSGLIEIIKNWWVCLAEWGKKMFGVDKI